MAEYNSNANVTDGTGGLVKKLLFPASSSGANKTFRPQTSPRPSPPPQHSEQYPSHRNESLNRNGGRHNNSWRGGEHAGMHSSSTNATGGGGGGAPPRFFSSTNPSIAQTNEDNHVDYDDNRGANQRQQPLQTPARVPSSPPSLNRQPVTPSSQMAFRTGGAIHVPENDTHQRKLFPQTPSMPMDSSREGEEEEKQPKEKSAEWTSPKEDEDDSLLFLKQFKANRQQKSTSNTWKDEEAAKTEVRDNTTAAAQRYLKEQEDELRHSRNEQQSVFATKMEQDKGSGSIDENGKDSFKGHTTSQPSGKGDNKAKFTNSESGQHTSHHVGASDPQPISGNRHASGSNVSYKGDEYDDDDDDDGNRGIPKSPFPSYYDNPYHNPLVASALKPNDLFHKSANQNDVSMESTSEVNSNMSEYGTIIGAPMSVLAERFAEVDEMERQGMLAMQEDDNDDDGVDQNFSDFEANDNQTQNDILDEEDPSLIVSYKAFRANDGDGSDQSNAAEEEEDIPFLKDPFQTPSSTQHTSKRIATADVPGPGVDDNSEMIQMGVDGAGQRDETQEEPAQETEIQSQSQKQKSTPHSLKELRSGNETDSIPIRAPEHYDDSASSIVDSEIDELVRRSASETSGNGTMKSCSSNNSAEVFRSPSTGSAMDKLLSHKPPVGPPLKPSPQSPRMPEAKTRRSSAGSRTSNSLDDSNDIEDEELQTIHGATSRDSSTLSKKNRPPSSLKRALANPHPVGKDPKHEHQGERPNQRKEKEDEKEEKEDDIHEHHHKQQYLYVVPKEDQHQNEASDQTTEVDVAPKEDQHHNEACAQTTKVDTVPKEDQHQHEASDQTPEVDVVPKDNQNQNKAPDQSTEVDIQTTVVDAVPEDEQHPTEVCEQTTEVDVGSSNHASTDNPGTPGADLASTLRRIGTKLAQRSPARSNTAVVQSPYFFDIDDDEDDGNNYNRLGNQSSAPSGSVSAPTTPRQQSDDLKQQRYDHHNIGHYALGKIQEAFPPQPPDRASTADTHSYKSAQTPSSFLLRSPGSTARLMADFRESSSSSGSGGNSNDNGNGDVHRFSVWNARIPSILQAASSASLDKNSTPRASGGGSNRASHDHNALVHPTKAKAFGAFARGCLSFDTTEDHHYEYNQQREMALFRGASNNEHMIQSAQSFDVRQHHQSSSSSSTAPFFRQRLKEFGGKLQSDKSKTQALYGSSRSWDISSGMASSVWSGSVGTGASQKETEDNTECPPGVTLDASTFRGAPFLGSHNDQRHLHPQVAGVRPERLEVNGIAFSPPNRPMASKNQRVENLELLQTPQRIEIEREDALNLLACLCERGVALHSQENLATSTEDQGHKSGESHAETTGENEIDPSLPGTPSDQAQDTLAADEACVAGRSKRPQGVDLEPETIYAVVEKLREAAMGPKVEESAAQEDSEFQSSDPILQLQVLDELLRSHDYAREMSRAALSASTWLRSIGHSDGKTISNKGPVLKHIPGEDHPQRHAETENAQAAEEGATPIKQDLAENENPTVVDMLSVKAMLHQAQMEAEEKNDLNRQLNEELSKCRAEIGRLKSEGSRAKTSFRSPNRSILDDAEDEEYAVSSAGGGIDKAGKAIARNNTDGVAGVARKDSGVKIGDDGFVDLDSSLFATEETAEVLRESDKPMVRELAMFKSALADANAIIKKLHSELKEVKPNDEDCNREAPVIEVSEHAFSVALVDDTVTDTSNIENSNFVSVQMLDAENFVTDWTRIDDSLPPPPDHGLRAPIVSALLQQWSADEGLRHSLMSWMDKAMSGEDPTKIPPLTLSSLDHQVRDGFTMHVLPLLLRRPDILVDVKSRAHRKTTYDIAVSVKRNTRLSVPVRSVRHMESMPDSASYVGSTTHSAVTAHVRNGQVTGNHYEVGSTAASYSNYTPLLPHRSSDDKGESGQQHAGLMSALGGALGGLLSRRKPNPDHFHDAVPASNLSYDLGSAAGVAMDFTPPRGSKTAQKEFDQDEPYHRLVSAPPGRIGVSFVEYRGHAMVSDVSEESPLLGWIFPSDILIAIDEVPVSGMRLKEIVKVLQGRKDRQRALRVISSHAMSEFAMSNSTPS